MRHLTALVLVAAMQAQAPVDFVRDVAPILQQRCVDCHGEKKQKGDLRLDRREFAFAGDPAAIVGKDAAASELLRRVQLPAGDEDVMPNEGPRLAESQIDVLRRWIEAGADWPAAGDEYFVAAAAAAIVPKIDFGIAAPDAAAQAAIDAALAALTTRGLVAQRVAADTPAISVRASLLGKAFVDDDLRLLAGLEPVLVWLNLSRTSVTDGGVAQLKSFVELRRLELANTAVGDAAFAALVLQKVTALNVYGSKVSDALLSGLQRWTQLRTVYAFETAVTADGAAASIAKRPELAIDRGDYAEARLRAAEAEIAARAAAKTAASAVANSKCPVSGDPVKNEQVVEHEGLRLAFCCAKCKATFTADPARFAAQIAAIKAAQPEAAAKKDEKQ